MLRVEDVDEGNVDDVFRVCSHSRLDDPLQREGMEVKRRWLLSMLERHGPCTKIAYLDDSPVAQALFYPEAAVPYIAYPREGVVVVHCVYNPFPESRGMGVGTALMEALIDDCRMGISVLGGGKCSYIVARPFNTGEGLSMVGFYSRLGFFDGLNEMYMGVHGSYEAREETSYVPLNEDRERAVALYEPLCEYALPQVTRVRELLWEVDPDLPVELIDSWERPEESMKRGNQWLVVNAKAIESYVTDGNVFRAEIERALGG